MKTAKWKVFCDISFFLALVFKMFSQGLRYFPVLDDYIQYGYYPLCPLSLVYFEKGTITTRPFAALFDPAVWGSFYPDLWVALAIICILFFLSAKLFASVFEKLNIHITPFLYAIYLLMPLGFEGTYWISASSRICVGMFFASLASYLIIKISESRKKWLWIPYVISTVLSCGFYESVMIVSCVLQFFVIMSITKSAKKRLTFLITPVLSGAGMLIYYALAKNVGAIGNRASGFDVSNIQFSSFADQLYEVFITGGIKTTFAGALDGLHLLVRNTDGLILLGLALAISVACALFGSKGKFYAKWSFCVPVGFILAVLPLAPNLLVETVWLTYRNAVTSFIGIVLMLAPLFNWLFRHRWAKFTVIFVLVFLFSLSNANELDTYKRVNARDQYLVSQVTKELDQEVLSGKKDAVVVLPQKVTTRQTSYYKDHVLGVFGSDWALTGAVRANLKNTYITKVTPVVKGENFNSAGCQVIYLKEN